MTSGRPSLAAPAIPNSASDVNHKGSRAQALSCVPPNCALSLKHHPMLQIWTISAEKAMMTYSSSYINSIIVWWQQPCINQHSIHTMGTLKGEQKLHVSVAAHIHYGITATNTKLNWCLTRSTNKSQELMENRNTSNYIHCKLVDNIRFYVSASRLLLHVLQYEISERLILHIMFFLNMDDKGGILEWSGKSWLPRPCCCSPFLVYF